MKSEVIYYFRKSRDGVGGGQPARDVVVHLWYLPAGRLKIRFFFQLLVTPVKQISSVATLSRAWKTGFGFPEAQELSSLYSRWLDLGFRHVRTFCG